MKMTLEQSQAIIERFHQRLNADGVVPFRAYRRNDPQYALVCMVNNIVALFIGGNLKVIPVFVSRIASQMEKSPGDVPCDEYNSLVKRYVTHMTWHLQTFHSMSNASALQIPKDILHGGFQAPPDML